MIYIIISLSILIIGALIMTIIFKSQIEKLNRNSDTHIENLRNQNAEQLNNLLTPLRMRLEDFNKIAEATHRDSVAERRSLSDQIQRLTSLNIAVGEEARNLAQALKGNNRITGRWGEIILESILDHAGLKNGINYTIQATKSNSGETLRNVDGTTIRPDLIIHLPDKRSIIIDSKASMTAYLDYTAAKSPDEEADAIKRLTISIKRHIESLAKKEYAKNIENASPNVMMFIPNDAAMILAINADNSISKFAAERNISLVSPSMLMATIGIIAEIWRKESQDRNALEIARLGGLLYDSVAKFTSELIEVEKRINMAQQSLSNAIRTLNSSPQSVLYRAKRLEEMGAKISKKISDL